MKKFLISMLLVLAIAFPVIAQENEAGQVNPGIQNDIEPLMSNYGSIKLKPLSITPGVWISFPYLYEWPWFTTGDTISVLSFFEIKGTGNIKIRIEIYDSTGTLIKKIKIGPYAVSSPTFQAWYCTFSKVAEPPGYFTGKIIYTDVKTGTTWSHASKVHISNP
jgi:hypothetical protein